MALLTIEVSGRHARTRTIIQDTVSAANRHDSAVPDASRATSLVSFLMCPFLCPRAVDRAENRRDLFCVERWSSGEFLITDAHRAAGHR